MAWPLSQDYNEAVQNPQTSFADAELSGGQAVLGPLGMPMPRSGNFADVYEFSGASGAKWAVKCFTREVPGLQQRYQQINLHLLKAKLPFMVEFQYQPGGIRVRGKWYPILKMNWVEGQLLNEFVRNNFDKPRLLEGLSVIWTKMSRWLRDARLAHADLQHGNVILVAGSKATHLAVKLIDYDGMYIPALATIPSGEVGHSAYQHPERIQKSVYSAEVDRFPLLTVACALRAVSIGGKSLWDKYDNGDNMLFKAADLANPAQSPLFRELWNIPDEALHDLLAYLVAGLRGPLDQAPLLHEVMPDQRARPPSAAVQQMAESTLGQGAKIVRTAPPSRAVVTMEAPAADDQWSSLDETEPKAPRPERSRTAAKRSRTPLLIGSGLAAVLVGAAVLFVVAMGGGKNKTEKDKIVQKDADGIKKDKDARDTSDKDSETKDPDKKDDKKPKKDGDTVGKKGTLTVAQVAGNYLLKCEGPDAGSSRLFLTRFGEVMLGGQPRGGWTVDDDKVRLNLDLKSHNSAILERTRPGVFAGLALGKDGKQYEWTLTSQKMLPPQSPGTANAVFLSDLPEKRENLSAANFRKKGVLFDGKAKRDVPIVIDGALLPHSLFMRPPKEAAGSVTYQLDKKYDYLLADVLIPQGLVEGQSNPGGKLVFEVSGDGTTLWESSFMEASGITERVKVPLKDISEIKLSVRCAQGNQFCHAVWVEPRLVPASAVVEVPVEGKFNPPCDILDKTPEWITYVACSADGRIALYSTENGNVVVWDAEANKGLFRFDEEQG